MNRFKRVIKAAVAIALTYVLCASALLQPMAVYAATLQAQQPAAETTGGSSTQGDSAGDASGDADDEAGKDAGSAGAAQDGETPADAADEDEKADGEDAAVPESLDTEDEQAADDAVIGDSEANSWRYQNGELRSDLRDDNATDLGIESRSMHEMPEGATMQGIDVSGYQKDIDWQKVKDAGIDFAILKIGNINARETDGWYTDSYFQRNVTECERLGIPYGVYAYSYAKNAGDAVKGANHIIALLKGHNPTLPVYLDLEDDSIKDTDHAAIAKAFCSTISAAGYAPGIYASAGWFKNILTDPCFSNSGWGIWTAQYWYGQRYDASLGLGPEYPAKFDCWQYSFHGSVPGVSGDVDVDYYYGNYVRDPSAPANVSAEPSGDGEVLVSWDAVPGAESYAIAERLPGGAFRTFTYDCLGTSYTVSDLANGVEHAFLVQARVGGRWSSFSSADLVRATPSGIVRPGAPGVDPLDSSAELSWGAVPGAESYAVATRTGGGAWVTHTYDCRGTSYTVRGLDNGRSYEFLVQARVGGRWSSFSESDITRALVRDPSAPANVSAEPSGDGEVLVSWDAVPGAESYAIAERLPGGAFRTFTYDCLGTSYTVSDLANGVEHAFLVQARVGGRWSSFSSADLVRATPSGIVRPGAPGVDPLDSSAELSWGAVPGAESYAVATRTGGGAWVTHTYDCRGTSYTVRGLDNGRSYEFLVQARVGGRWSSFSESDITRAIPADGISPDPEVTPSGDGVLTLTWDSIPGATSYAIAEWKNGKYYTYSLDCLSTSYTVENLSNGRDHYFLVQAYVNGRWSSSSPALRVVGRPVGTTKPTVSVSAGYQSAYLSWNAVPGASRYAIAIRDSKGSYKTLTYNCASTSYTAIDLPGGYPCTLLVQAYCDGQWSQFSEGDHVKVTPEGPAYLEYLGFQNPSRYFQVSSHSVTIKNQGFGLFGYRTESRIPRRATRDDCVNAMIGRAYEYIGTPYKWNYSCAPGVGVDCAGLVMQCLYATGMDLSPMNPWDHYNTPGHDQYANLMWKCGKFKQVPFSERQRGDLISYPGHIAIYLGNDRIIEAAGPGLGVREHSVYIGSRIRGVLRPFV